PVLTGHLPRDQVAPAEPSPGQRRNRREVQHRGSCERRGARHRGAYLLEDPFGLPVPMPGTEGVTLKVTRQANPRREDDVGIRSARLEPAQPEPRRERKVQRHVAASSARIWSRSSAARSKSSFATAWSSFRRSPLSRCWRSASVGSGGRYTIPTYCVLPFHRRRKPPR